MAVKKKTRKKQVAKKRVPKKKAARKRVSKGKVSKKKAPGEKAARKSISKKKPAKKKAPSKKAAKKKSAARTAVKRKGATRSAGKKTSTSRAGSRKPTVKETQQKTAAAARAEAERRAAAVREQLSRAQLGTFEDLFENAEPEVRTIGYQLRNLVMELIPSARETVYLRWKIALYKVSTEICGIQPASDRCNFYLTKGAYLHDPQGLLEGTGKAIRHVKVRSVVGMAAEGLRDLVKQSLEITAV